MSELEQCWQAHFPALWQRADPWLRQRLREARLVSLPAGQAVFYPDMHCEAYLLVIDGRVRVQLTGEAGREVVLYRVAPGQSCVLTTSCLLGADHYPAEGVTETPVRAFAIPVSRFHEALERSAVFRRFVFANFGQRLAEVIQRMELITQRSIEERLARVLLQLGGAQAAIQQTHQSLAAELGSAREVVSRHLKRFEEQGWVRLGRGTIEVLDSGSLERIGRLPPV